MLATTERARAALVTIEAMRSRTLSRLAPESAAT